MQLEILNLDYHVCRLTVKALNKFKEYEEAAKALGVTTRTLRNYKRQFKIIRVSDEFIAFNPVEGKTLRTVEQG